MLFQGRCKVVHVIHVKAENYAAPDMTPEARSVLALVITPFGQSLFEELVGNDAGLGEAIHAFTNLDIDPSVIVDQVPEVVFFDDLVRDEFESEAHVFRIIHWRVEVEVGQVNAQEYRARCADCGVDEEFGGEKVRSGGALVAGKVDEIAADRHASAMDLFLVRADVADDAPVGGALVFWDF